LLLQEFLRASQFRIFLSDDFPGIVRHQYHANSFFFSSALRADRTEPVVCWPGRLLANIRSSVFCLSRRFVQFRIFLFDDLQGTVKLQSSAFFVCLFSSGC